MKKIALSVACALIVIGIVLTLFNKKDKAPPENEQLQNNQQITNNVNQPNSGTVWYGVLKISDNSAKGNLMLIHEPDKPVYFNTVRDFSSLVDKEVAVSIEGDRFGFKLLDIKSK